MAKPKASKLTDLIERIKADRSNSFGAGTPGKDIEKLEEDLAIKLPDSFVTFLETFNGGEFLFGRMHAVTADGAGFFDFRTEYEHFYEKNEDLTDEDLVPFGDDYGGNYYCFDLAAMKDNECPIVQWDLDSGANQEPRHVANCFTEWLEEEYEALDPEERDISFYIASDAELMELTADGASKPLEVALANDVFPYIRKSIEAGNIYNVNSSSNWTGYYPDELEENGGSANATPLKGLGLYIEQMLDEIDRPIEIYVTASGELSSDSRYKIVLGNMKICDEQFELKLGDHLKVHPDGTIDQMPRMPLPRAGDIQRQPPGEDDFACSWCDTPQSETRKIIAHMGRDLRICDQCVLLCYDILESEGMFDDT